MAMTRWYLVALSLLAGGSVVARAQSARADRVWIFLRDGKSYDINSARRAPSSIGITDRALTRRAKVVPADRLIDDQDLPVSDAAIARIRQSGAQLRAISRWFNAVSVEATQEQLKTIMVAPGAAAVAPVRRLVRRPDPSDKQEISPLARSMNSGTFDYGASLTQLSNMHAVELHDLGITGKGVLIAMLDDGFNNHRVHEALRSLSILDEWDFVQGDANTSIAPGEHAGQGDHGAGTLSVVGGFGPGTLIGAAPGAAFLLYKTEIDSVEIHTEEDNYVQAIERAERLGADISSSSLGYRDFDTTTTSYPYSALNGHTTIVAKAASIATRKGMLVITAMGNEGGLVIDSTGTLVHAGATLVSPADADSIIAVGATSSDGELATFSGTGPSSDGRIKPELVAQGLGVVWALGTTTNGYGMANGTSLATPLVAGGAALVLSAHPEFGPMQLRQELLASARVINDGTWQTASYPNNYYGFGFINALQAALSTGPICSNTLTTTVHDTTVEVRLHLRSSAGLVPDSLKLFFKRPDDPGFMSAPLVSTGNLYEYMARVSTSLLDRTSLGYVAFADSAGRSRRNPYNAPDSLLTIVTSLVPPRAYVLYPNYPNPFSTSTTIIADIPVAGPVEVSVFNILGQHVRTLATGTAVPPQLVVRWNGHDDAGYLVASGVYFCRLKTPSATVTNKLLYLKHK